MPLHRPRINGVLGPWLCSPDMVSPWSRHKQSVSRNLGVNRHDTRLVPFFPSRSTSFTGHFSAESRAGGKKDWERGCLSVTHST